jgi:hypothetical protein
LSNPWVSGYSQFASASNFSASETEKEILPLAKKSPKLRAIQGSGDAKAADTREGPGDLRSEEQMSEANRAGGRPEFKLGFAGALAWGP